MRTECEQLKNLSKELASHIDGDIQELEALDICEIELGLSVISTILPDTPVRALWVLLTGYPFATDELLHLTSEQIHYIGITRHILLRFKNQRRWQQALQRYRSIKDRIRLYDVDEALEKCIVREISICTNRSAIYEQIVRQPLPYAARKISWATSGSYRCSDGRKTVAVTIPDNFPLPPPPSDYQLAARKSHAPIRVKWTTLLATARWMDKKTKQANLPARNWYNTLKRVRLLISPDENSEFLPIQEITFEKTLHAVGMVSAGKSTLMDVLAVWATLKGYRITLAVGDVMAVFDRLQFFLSLGLKAAPITGVTNRTKHRKRLHRILSSERSIHPFQHQHAGFDYTSTACLLDGLRNASKPFQMDPQPCLSLRPISLDEEEEEILAFNQGKACPLYSVCPYHRGQLDLVDASIWIATPASLIYTHVDPQIHRERTRFIEMVYLHCDLVVIDEADRVQVQLDSLFSPSITLMSRNKDSWLGNLAQKVTQELSREGLGQLKNDKVRNWVKDLMDAQDAVHSLYALILNEPALSSWIDQERDYFSGLTLLEKLTVEVCGITKTKDQSPFDDPTFQEFWIPLATFLDDPLGERDDHELADLARQVMAVRDSRVRKRLQQWLQKQPHIVLAPQEFEDYALRLEFAIMLEVLSDSLRSLINEWKQVEAVLGLEGSGSLLFHSPPDDYAALIPEAPMGNILGFQYLKLTHDPKNPGELRFFHCMGVGRWLMLHMHDFLQADGIAGPHVLLLSGTSWAGTSPNYHIQIPVTGVLLAPDDEIEEINKSVFEYKFQRDQTREPITISGKQGNDRILALYEMLDALSQEQNVGNIPIPSRLEQARNDLPEGRKRILLVVGSYPEAEEAYRYLSAQRDGWENQMAYLVPDDTEFESTWRNKEKRLHRGLVSQFSTTNAWILIAPLLAIERGHNILNEEKKAAIGAAFFLIRPHPRPDDIHYIIHSINSWAIEHHRAEKSIAALTAPGTPTLETVGKKFRSQSFGEWRRLLRTPLRYSSLRDSDREALIWSQLVSIWQVIGRLVRGGCAARVFFCDAKFAPQRANLQNGDKESTSLIVGMLEVLRPYFTNTSTKTPREKDLVRILYGPLFNALNKLEGNQN